MAGEKKSGPIQTQDYGCPIPHMQISQGLGKGAPIPNMQPVTQPQASGNQGPGTQGSGNQGNTGTSTQASGGSGNSSNNAGT